MQTQTGIIFLIIFLSITNKSFAYDAEKYIEIIDKSNLVTALKIFDQDLKNDKNFQEVCHPIAHQIGIYSYNKFGIKKVLANRVDTCGSGYVHGSIEKFIETHPKFEIKKVCLSGDLHCYHGLGHGLMLIHNKNPKTSLNKCDSLRDIKARYNCYDGVWMEYFGDGTDQKTSQLVDSKNPSKICEIVNPKYRVNCYFYLPRYYLSINKDDLNEVENICRKIKISDTRNYCFKGLGSSFAKAHLGNKADSQNYFNKLNQQNKKNAKQFWLGVQSYENI